MTVPVVAASIDIDAPIDVVWGVMVDFDRYGQWNPFVVGIELPHEEEAHVGDDLRLHVRWSGGRGFHTTERITRLEPPSADQALLEYEFGGPIAVVGLVRGRRAQRLELIDGARTRYQTGISFRGFAARLVPRTRVRDGFERHATALKERSEALSGSVG